MSNKADLHFDVICGGVAGWGIDRRTPHGASDLKIVIFS